MQHRAAFKSIVVACAVACIGLSCAPAKATPDADGASLVFADAEAICTRDHGALWGTSLCGPILIVDPVDHGIIANHADRDGVLKSSGAVFTGTLPESVIVADTPTEWSGTRWTQLLWPVQFETIIRHVTIAHELFHRIQPGLGLSRPEAGNRHLDTLEGRYLLQLEWRALARALMAEGADARKTHITDALAFRHERYRLFKDAATEEGALETNEGIPEYTGVRLGLDTDEARLAYAIFDLSRYVDVPTFVRSLAYATGPAYGLLLDQSDPGWRGKLKTGKRLDQLLADALAMSDAPAAALDERVRRYDDGTLRTRETHRDNARRAQIAAYKARLIDGPVVVLPLAHANFRFNPQTLVPLEGAGTIYPTMQLIDDWGDLLVKSEGALVYADMSKATVSATGADATHLKGKGWTLTLKTGWQIRRGPRADDWTVVRDGQ